MRTTAPHDGAKVALFLGDRLICILRDDDPSISYPNLWDLPGGGREGTETPFETVARELQEELGLDLPASAILWESAFPAIGIANAWVAFFVAQLPADMTSRVTFGDEGQRWDLFTLDEFLELDNRVPSYGSRLRAWMDETSGLKTF